MEGICILSCFNKWTREGRRRTEITDKKKRRSLEIKAMISRYLHKAEDEIKKINLPPMNDDANEGVEMVGCDVNRPGLDGVTDEPVLQSKVRNHVATVFVSVFRLNCKFRNVRSLLITI